MAAYTPLARKYRPQTFEELVGQSHVTTTISRALDQQRVAQAYLFSGVRGVGKTSAARILAKCLNCEKGPTSKPCNTCSNCVQTTQGSSLDVMEIDGASNRGIDEIRSLRETVPYAPTTGNFHIYIIDEVHMLTTEAFNALLKTLEEPPAHVKFIFATTAPSKVPATILSRCQRFDFKRIEVPIVVQQLKGVAGGEKIKIDEPALYAIARASEGSLRDAEVILDQLSSFVDGRITEKDVAELLGAVGSDELFAMTEAILDRQPVQALEHIVAQRDRGKAAPDILQGLLWHVRNLLMMACAKDGSQDALLARLIDEPSDRITRLGEQAGRTTAQELVVFLQILTQAYDMIRRTPLSQMVLELAVVKLATREQWQTLDEISRRLEQMSRSGGGVPSSGAAAPMPSPRPAVKAAVGIPAAGKAKLIPVPEAVAEAVAEAIAARDGVDGILQGWNRLLEMLGSRKMSLAAYLADSKPLRIEGKKLIVGLPAFSLHQEVVSVAENRKLMESLIKEACNIDVTVQYEVIPENAAAGGAADAPAEATPTEEGVPMLVNDIVRLFNATVLNQPPAGG